MGLIIGVLIIKGVVEEVVDRVKEVIEELLPGFEGTIVEYEDFDAEVSFLNRNQILLVNVSFKQSLGRLYSSS